MTVCKTRHKTTNSAFFEVAFPPFSAIMDIQNGTMMRTDTSKINYDKS